MFSDYFIIKFDFLRFVYNFFSLLLTNYNLLFKITINHFSSGNFGTIGIILYVKKIYLIYFRKKINR